ncbi:TadE/TadG family type IV pilus assembly protein [Agromyces sp. NPDC056523]|uniref:TadE/TadG family type IV pilus assembly protein n=1 Tax=Agromyces sp. NPDC056523 TaxID=3345850 RepID=UPI00366EF3EB
MEFALVFPLVIILLITIIEFSRLWNVQATITSAAAVGARYAAVHFDPDFDATEVGQLEDDAEDEARSVPGFLDWDTATVEVTVSCVDAGIATSEITVSPGAITEWFGDRLGTAFDLNATGTMPCTG